MENLVDKFCLIARKYKDKRIDVLLNAFTKTRTKDEQLWITQNYILFIRAAECMKNTDEEILVYIQ